MFEQAFWAKRIDVERRQIVDPLADRRGVVDVSGRAELLGQLGNWLASNLGQKAGRYDRRCHTWLATKLGGRLLPGSRQLLGISLEPTGRLARRG